MGVLRMSLEEMSYSEEAGNGGQRNLGMIMRGHPGTLEGDGAYS
jgi:hypothetical protein